MRAALLELWKLLELLKRAALLELWKLLELLKRAALLELLELLKLLKRAAMRSPDAPQIRSNLAPFVDARQLQRRFPNKTDYNFENKQQ